MLTLTTILFAQVMVDDRHEISELPENAIIVSVDNASREESTKLLNITGADSVAYYGKNAFILYFKNGKPDPEQVKASIQKEGVKVHEIRY